MFFRIIEKYCKNSAQYCAILQYFSFIAQKYCNNSEKYWLILWKRAILKKRERKNIQHQQKQQIILIRLFNLLLFQLVNSTIVLFLDSNPMKLSYFFENGKKDKRCLLSNIHDGIKIQKRKLEYTRERGGKSYSEDTSHLFVLY